MILSLAIFPGGVALSQTASPARHTQAAAEKLTPQAAPAANTVQSVGTEEKDKKAVEPESETEAFRHSPVVAKFASVLHLSIETAARLFEFFNFAILAFAILYVAAKLLPNAFRSRRIAIQKELVDARSATQVANERLDGVEQRLSHLDQEIDAIRTKVEQDAIQDEARIKAALEEERLRIVDSAGHEIEAAAAAAQRELKRFAAELAIARATSQLSLTEETDRKLVRNFSRGLSNDQQEGRN